MPMNEKEPFMRIALDEAKAAFDAGEIPVGAVLVHDGTIVARAHNECEQRGDATAHAELLCLQRGAATMGKRLSECTLYVTLEPCAMCTGACVSAQLGEVVFGAYDAQCGCCGSQLDLAENGFGYRVRVWGGLLESECAALITAFFERLRA